MIPPVILSALLEGALLAKGPRGLTLRGKLELALVALELPAGPLREAVVRLCRADRFQERIAGEALLAQVDYANRVPPPEVARGRADLDG